MSAICLLVINDAIFSCSFSYKIQVINIRTIYWKQIIAWFRKLLAQQQMLNLKKKKEEEIE